MGSLFKAYLCKLQAKSNMKIKYEIDADSKLGPGIIKGDPKEQSKNGKLLEQVVTDNNLVIVNGTELCDGVVTRQRTTVERNEES